MSKHLRYVRMALGNDDVQQAQNRMEDLGISYGRAYPVPMIDEWWFFDCENIPAELPHYLRPLDVDPNNYP